MLKALIGQGHAEFAGMKQQDAQEFLIWLVSRIQRQGKATGCVEQRLVAAEREAMKDDDGWGGYVDPTNCFKFAVQQRIQCLGCSGVKYRVDQVDNLNFPIPDKLKYAIGKDTLMLDLRRIQKPRPSTSPLNSRIASRHSSRNRRLNSPVLVAVTHTLLCKMDSSRSLTCSSSPPPALFTKTGCQRNLVDQAKASADIDVPLIVPETLIPLSQYIVPRGLQPGEQALLETGESAESLAPLNEEASRQLLEMGFPFTRVEKALRITGNASADTAMQWLFEHMDDPDIDIPYQASATAKSTRPVDQESLDNLICMGFEEHMTRKALQETVQPFFSELIFQDGNMERAVDWLFSHPAEAPPVDAYDSNANAVSVSTEDRPAGHSGVPANYQLESVVMHKGASVHAGHYVAFIRKEIPGIGEDWVLFNDEKVVRGGDWKEVFKTGYVYFFRRGG
jgi:ubiquitin carboxyl-terminal hydrolase 5/13